MIDIPLRQLEVQSRGIVNRVYMLAPVDIWAPLHRDMCMFLSFFLLRFSAAEGNDGMDTSRQFCCIHTAYCTRPPRPWKREKYQVSIL